MIGIVTRNGWVLLALACAALSGAALAQSPPGAVPDLVRGATSSSATDAIVTKAMRTREVMRSRGADLDVAMLRGLQPSLAAGAPQRMRIAFFDDAAPVVEIVRTEAVGRGATAYIGTIPGDALGSAVIVEEDGVIAANVDFGGARYQIRNFGGAGHVLRQIDDSAFAPEAPPRRISAAPRPGARDDPKALPAAVQAPADDGSQIDVMVVYTPAARSAQGGTAAMMSLVSLGIAETNTAYSNSGVIQRLRLVYAGEVNYKEVDSSTDLDRLQDPKDGYMDEVHTLRDANGADFVSLWGVYSDVCGRGFEMDTESSGFASHAFNLVDYSCATGQYSFGHELGHNMGLHHDNYVDDGTTDLTQEGATARTTVAYAHGYVDLGNRVRTVMAYNDQCKDAGYNCRRIQAFSSPNVTFNNSAYYAGAGTAVIGNAVNAHARRALNDTRETTANFRVAGGGGGPPNLVISTYAASVLTVAAGGSVTLSATVTNAGGGTSAATTLRYYYWTGAAWSEIGFCADAIPALVPNATSVQSCAVIPVTFTGTSQFRVAVDTVAGEAQTSDNTSGSITIAVVSPAGLDWSDLWYVAAESGWGANLMQNQDVIFITFFIYGANKAPTWYVTALAYDGAGAFAGDLFTASGTYFAAPWVPGNAVGTKVGTAKFTPSAVNIYEGTLVYTVTGVGATTKQVVRQSLKSIALGGSYVGGQSGSYGGCNTASANGPYKDRYSLDVDHRANGSVTFTFAYSGSVTCTLAGQLQQHGQVYVVPSATYACSNGLSTTASMSQIRATSLGIEGRIYAPNVGDSCTESAAFGAVLR
jgi:hypothetical protein